MARNTNVTADTDAPPVTRILAEFVARRIRRAAGATPSSARRIARS